MIYTLLRRVHVLVILVAAVGIVGVCWSTRALAITNPQSGSFGLEGTVNALPPTTTAPIAIPSNGETYTSQPVTVSGICTGNLLVELFSNGVFIGSAVCNSNSYTISAALFEGQNQLLTRQYDALNQPGPDSPTVTVTYQNTTISSAQQVSLTSIYAQRGATPGTPIVFPISISGGTGPYAISVDWGDGSSPDLLSETGATTFNIQHAYKESGVYTILIKATDHDGSVTFLQLVGIGNGTIYQSVTTPNANGSTTAALAPKTNILWEPAALAVPLMIVAFWLGRRYELDSLRRNFDRRREDDR